MKEIQSGNKYKQESIKFHESQSNPQTPMFMFKEVKRSFLPDQKHENNVQFIGSTMDEWLIIISNPEGEYRVEWKKKVNFVVSEAWLDTKDDVLYVGNVRGEIYSFDNRNGQQLQCYHESIQNRIWKPIQLLYSKNQTLLAVTLSNVLYGFSLKPKMSKRFQILTQHEITASLTIYNPFLCEPSACMAFRGLPPIILNKNLKEQIELQLCLQQCHYKENCPAIVGQVFQLAYSWSGSTRYLCAAIIKQGKYNIQLYKITQKEEMSSAFCQSLYELQNIFSETPLHFHINIYNQLLIVTAWNKYLFYDLERKQPLRKINKNSEDEYKVCWGFILRRISQDLVYFLSFRGLPYQYELWDSLEKQALLIRTPSLHFHVIGIPKQ